MIDNVNSRRHVDSEKIRAPDGIPSGARISPRIYVVYHFDFNLLNIILNISGNTSNCFCRISDP